MKTLQRLVYVDLCKALVFVTLSLLSLVYFFDLVEEIPDVGKKTAAAYTLTKAFLYTASLLPEHLYEILPIATLIACTFVMARFAQTQEFTVLRTSGLSPLQALRIVSGFGLGVALLCFTLGEYGLPVVRKFTETLKNPALSDSYQSKSGAWLKASEGTNSFIVNLLEYDRTAPSMHGTSVYQFDAQGRIHMVLQASSARFTSADIWTLQDLKRTEFTYAATTKPASDQRSVTPRAQGTDTPLAVTHAYFPSYRWRSPINQAMVESTALRPQRMVVWNLYQHIRHLKRNGQNAQAYEVAFWQKVFYPLSCLVMVVLALPFAYLHFRSGSVASFVFVGVLIGVSFFLINSVFGYLGYLHRWIPWLAAGVPAFLYSIFALIAFSWLVLRH